MKKMSEKLNQIKWHYSEKNIHIHKAPGTPVPFTASAGLLSQGFRNRM